MVPKQGMVTAVNAGFWSIPDMIKGLHRYQKGQSGIQPAGNSHHRIFAVGMLQPFFQTHGLNG